MSNEMVLKKLDEAAKAGCELTRNIQASFSGALRVATVARQVREALTPEIVQEFIVPLQECDFGWRTDGKGYTIQQIRDVWVSAAMLGAAPVNNEVNMISGRCYLAKNYFKRMLRDFPGLTDLAVIPGRLTMTTNGALAEYTATWKLHGKEMSLNRVEKSAIPVRLNAGMGADGALGKAERKMLAAVFSMITGSTFSDGELDDVADHASHQVTNAKYAPDVEAKIQPRQELPEPEKPTQAQVVAKRVKEQKAKQIEAPAPVVVDETEKAPWDGDDNQSQSEPAIEQQPAEQPAAEEKKPAQKTIGWVKDTTTGEMKKVTKEENGAQPTATPAEKVEKKEKKTKQEAAPAPEKQSDAPKPPESPEPQKSEEAGQGVIEIDNIGKISSIRAKDKNRTPPYTILAENGTQYVTNDVEVAKKANEYKSSNVPVSIEYTVDAEGRYMIVSVKPEDLEVEAQDGSDFEQP